MEIKKKIVEVVYIEFDGIKFYPDRKGYWLGNIDNKPVRLHRYVWEKHNGKIPKGYHVHHKDHNTNNNDISNLELIEQKKHLSMHALEERNIALARKNLKKYGFAKASEWHKSKDGKEWHRQHYETTLSKYWDKKVIKRCIVCGKLFEVSVLMEKKSKFCSNNCKSQYRRDMKIDNTEAVCKICGKKFMTNRYSPAKYCSSECRNIGRKKAKQQSSRH